MPFMHEGQLVAYDFINRCLKPVEQWERDRAAFVEAYDRRYAGRPMRPMIISDDLKAGVNGMFHPVNGKRVDSKSEFRRITKEAGCVEVGDERSTTKRQQLDSPGEDLARVFNELS